MSKRNSRKAKQERREKSAWKTNRYTPCPIPENDYIIHSGFIPNHPFFHNSAVATIWEDGGRLALRTKSQLLDFIETTDYDFSSIVGTTDKEYIHLSVFYLFNDFTKVSEYKRGLSRTSAETMFRTQFIDFDGSTNIGYEEENINRCLYCFRPQLIGNSISKDPEEHKLNNPNYSYINSLNVPFDEIQNLPDGRWSMEEFIKFAKLDESITPLRDDELENWFSSKDREDAIREGAYETNEEGEVIIDEFQGIGSKEGKTFYQPRKTDAAFMTSFHPAFFNDDHFCIANGGLYAGGIKKN